MELFNQKIIDTHCHLDQLSPTIIDDLLAIKDLSFIVPGIKSNQWNDLITLKERSSNVAITLGIHPWEVDNHTSSDLDTLESLLAHANGIGEIGLDCYESSHQRMPGLQHQLGYFRTQLELATKHQKPVILHCRKAFSQLYQELLQYKDIQAVYHSAHLSREESALLIKRGISFGLGTSLLKGPISLNVSDGIKLIPKELILLETDSPYMKLKGEEIGSPLTVYKVALLISKIRGIDPIMLIEQCNQNAANLFGIV